MTTSSSGFTDRLWERIKDGSWLDNHELKKMGVYQPNVSIYDLRQNGWVLEDWQSPDRKTWRWRVVGHQPGYEYSGDGWRAVRWPGYPAPKPKVLTRKRQAKQIGEAVRDEYAEPDPKQAAKIMRQHQQDLKDKSGSDEVPRLFEPPAAPKKRGYPYG